MRLVIPALHKDDTVRLTSVGFDGKPFDFRHPDQQSPFPELVKNILVMDTELPVDNPVIGDFDKGIPDEDFISTKDDEPWRTPWKPKK